jgi:hypothetical protein
MIEERVRKLRATEKPGRSAGDRGLVRDLKERHDG